MSLKLILKQTQEPVSIFPWRCDSVSAFCQVTLFLFSAVRVFPSLYSPRQVERIPFFCSQAAGGEEMTDNTGQQNDSHPHTSSHVHHHHPHQLCLPWEKFKEEV